MGITWIYEDAAEAYYSSTEQVPSPSGQLKAHTACPFCGELFSDFSSMQRHAAKDHRLRPPALMWNKREVSVEQKIASQGNFSVANCTRARLSVDGSPEEPIAVDDLVAHLSTATDAVVRVRLDNQPNPRMAAATRNYRINFRIAELPSLVRVEEAFRQYLVRSTPTPDAIRLFLEDPRCEGIASDYAAGLYAYVHGLLLKEGLGMGRLFSEYAMHRERFGEALEKLEGLERKLARSVCTVVRLMQNDVSGDSNLAPGTIRTAYAMLRGPAAAISGAPPGDRATEERLCPVDHGTSRIIDLAVRLSAADRWSNLLEEECRSIVSGGSFPIEDRRKVFAYWAGTALRLGDRHAARYPLQQIASVYPFDGWAAAALEEA